jgi:hypothetical protein
MSLADVEVQLGPSQVDTSHGCSSHLRKPPGETMATVALAVGVTDLLGWFGIVRAVSADAQSKGLGCEHLTFSARPPLAGP